MKPRAIILVISLMVLAGICFFRWRSAESKPEANLDRLLSAATKIQQETAAWDRRLWAPEMEALRHEQAVVRLWDALRESGYNMGVFGEWPLGSMRLPTNPETNVLSSGVRELRFGPAEEQWNDEEWNRRLAQFTQQGLKLHQVEFRHVLFESRTNGGYSRFWFSLHATKRPPSSGGADTRLAISGTLKVNWQKATNTQPVLPSEVSVIDLTIRQREGPPAFREILREQIIPEEKSHFIDPLVVGDLNGDQRPDVLLGCRNLIFWNGGTQLKPAALCAVPPQLIFTAITADLDRDGKTDFLCADRAGLLLYAGGTNGDFSEAPRRVWAAQIPLRYVQALTVGDIDRDGDLDLWLAQYKEPYTMGQMPRPIYDANDGNPSYLLINDGLGNFKNETSVRFPAGRNLRRSYSASWIDLDDDTDLDLLTVNDFAGIDAFQNDGSGRFVDATTHWFAEPRLLGMGHAAGDFNSDGRLDLFAVGMNSPAVDRLIHLQLARPDFTNYFDALGALTAGNRLYLGHESRFTEAKAQVEVSRTGWSWGAAAGDFNNDGFEDIHVVNGHSSNRSAADYESQFWRHDIYVGDSKTNRAADLYFRTVNQDLRGGGMSYGGYEKNRLLMNLGDARFAEVAFLMGTALEEDCRNVVTADIDLDGDLDLLLTTYEIYPRPLQTLRIFLNELPQMGNWIGFQFRDEAKTYGARAVLRSGSQKAVRMIITGDSHRSQHPRTVHFGLGAATNVGSVEITFADGSQQRIDAPAINRYHQLQ